MTAKNRDQLRNPTLGNLVWAPLPFLYLCVRALLTGRGMSRIVELGSADEKKTRPLAGVRVTQLRACVMAFK